MSTVGKLERLGIRVPPAVKRTEGNRLLRDTDGQPLMIDLSHVNAQDDFLSAQTAEAEGLAAQRLVSGGKTFGETKRFSR